MEALIAKSGKKVGGGSDRRSGGKTGHNRPDKLVGNSVVRPVAIR